MNLDPLLWLLGFLAVFCVGMLLGAAVVGRSPDEQQRRALVEFVPAVEPHSS